MVRSRLLIAVLIVAGVACKKDDAPAPAGGDKPTADKPGDKPADKGSDTPAVADKAKPGDPAKAEAPPPPLAPVKAGPNSADLAILPVDSDNVIGINFSQVQQSPLWKDYISGRVMADDVKTNLDELKKCGLDPLAVIKSITIGYKNSAAGRDGVVVAHGLDKAKTLACADKLKADPASKADITHDGDIVIVKKKGGNDAVALTFTGDDTAVATIGSKATADGVKAAAAVTSGLDKSARFVELYNKVDTSKSLWFVVNGKSDAFKQMAAMGLKPKHVFGQLDLSSGVGLTLLMRLDSADAATQMAMTMKQQLGMVSSMLHLDKNEASSDGADLKLEMAVAAANIGALTKQMKAMAGMAGGGGMGKP